jgi:hypothetical protein
MARNGAIDVRANLTTAELLSVERIDRTLRVKE